MPNGHNTPQAPTGMPPSGVPASAGGAGDWLRQLAPLLSTLPLLLQRGGAGAAASFLSGFREAQQERALGQHAARQETEGRRRFEAGFGLRTEENRRAEREAARRNEKDYLEAVAQVAETASEILDETQRQAYLTRMTTLLEQRWPQKRTRQILRDIQASPEAVRKWAQDTLDRFLKTHPSIGEHPDAANVEIQTPLGGKSLSEIMRMAGVEGLDPQTGKPIRVAKPPKEERDSLGIGVSAEAARARIAAFQERHGRKPTAAEQAELLESPKADTPAEQRATRKEQQAEAQADLRAALDAGEPLDAFPARFKGLGLNYATELAKAKRAAYLAGVDLAGKIRGLERRDPLTGAPLPGSETPQSQIEAATGILRGQAAPKPAAKTMTRRELRAAVQRLRQQGMTITEEQAADEYRRRGFTIVDETVPRLIPSH